MVKRYYLMQDEWQYARANPMRGNAHELHDKAWYRLYAGEAFGQEVIVIPLGED